MGLISAAGLVSGLLDGFWMRMMDCWGNVVDLVSTPRSVWRVILWLETFGS
jgi:hypothetical protein